MLVGVECFIFFSSFCGLRSMEVILSLPVYLLWCLPFSVVCCLEYVPAKVSDVSFLNYFYFQDPTNLDKFNVSNFFHVKNNIKVIDPGKDELKVG